MVLSDLMAQLKTETDVVLPGWREIRVYKANLDSGANQYAGAWTAGHFVLKYFSLPPPPVPPAAELRADPAQAVGLPALKSAVFGVFNGRSFVPTRPISIEILSEDELLEEFERAVPGIGREVRFFIVGQEVEPLSLVPGQPYSVYPKSFKRVDETRATVADPVQAIRYDGPMVNIQWVILDTDRNQLAIPGSGKVPEEITLLQLCKVVAKSPVPETQIIWGNHLRSGDIIETGHVTTLEEADFVEILVDNGAAPAQTHIEVKYKLGSETFDTRVRKDATIGDLKEALSYVHRGRQIQAVAFEGADIDQADPVDDWMGRSLNHPLELRVAALVAPPASAPTSAPKAIPRVYSEWFGDGHQGSLDITSAGCKGIAGLPPEVVGPSRGAI
jgi:hypothetical protein